MDKIKLGEVISFGENNYTCYKHLVNEYLNNMKRRWLNGSYDRNKTIKLLEYYYSNYVRPEFRKRTEMGYDPKLTPEERKVFAIHFRNYLENEFLKKLKKHKK